MAKQRKYYVVWEGNEKGVFDNWGDCAQAVKGYSGAKFKSFPTRGEAEQAFKDGAFHHINFKNKDDKKSGDKKGTVPRSKIVKDSISVDAACSGNPGLMEYRGVLTATGAQIFHQGPFPQGTNNIGEFLALVHGLALLKKKEMHHLPIYSDSKIAMGWVYKGKCNTKVERTAANKELFEIVERAEKWLAKNTFKNPLLKWETKSWGEIPADFGRK